MDNQLCPAVGCARQRHIALFPGELFVAFGRIRDASDVFVMILPVEGDQLIAGENQLNAGIPLPTANPCATQPTCCVPPLLLHLSIMATARTSFFMGFSRLLDAQIIVA